MTEHRASAAVELSSWAATFSCYTAALAVWLAQRREQWWRPLLAGGPVLAVTPAADGLLRFEHHPRPPLQSLGLTARQADDWATARAGQLAELSERDALIVCGDVYNLPWQRGHQRWHAPHWFTIVPDGGRQLIVDPLEMMTSEGLQSPCLVPVDPAMIEWWAVAPPDYAPVYRLRELSIAGGESPSLGGRYRWLEGGCAPQASEYPPGRLVGSAAVEQLAARFRAAGGDDPLHTQADDLWQALRQRELLVAAAQADPGLVPSAVAEHWQRAVAKWRRVPQELMHARLRSQSGLPAAPDRIADALAAVARFEDLCQLADTAGQTADPGPRRADGHGDQ